MNDDGSQNVDLVKDSINEINNFNQEILIVIKSTVLPKYIEDILEISENLVINPEFLRENFANEDFINSEIIVFGGEEKNCAKLGNFYEEYTKCICKDYVKTDLISASLLKYTINSFLALKVIFFNELKSVFDNSNSNNELSDQVINQSDESKAPQPIVNEEDIAHIVASWTGVPVQKLTESESVKLLNMEDTLHQRLIGQDEAVKAVSKAIRRARVGLKNPNRPIASFIFSGPTGVGKTELTKALAAYFFGSEEAMIRLDMSEFMERHTVSKLIGSPPGYVGFNEGGQLTEAVRRRPYTVVLFDEIEKAHPDVFNLLLQLLEEGRLTDSKGRTVDFKNTLIIMTSNIGSKVIEKGGGGLGFELSGENLEDTQYNRIKSLVNEELKQYFRPEFLNRLDEIIVFRQLSRNEVKDIAEIMLKEVFLRIKEKGISLTVSDDFKERLVEEGYNPSYGARPLRRAVMRLLEDSLAEEFLSGRIKDGDKAEVDIDESKKVIVKHLGKDSPKTELASAAI